MPSANPYLFDRVTVMKLNNLNRDDDCEYGGSGPHFIGNGASSHIQSSRVNSEPFDFGQSMEPTYEVADRGHIQGNLMIHDLPSQLHGDMMPHHQLDGQETRVLVSGMLHESFHQKLDKANTSGAKPNADWSVLNQGDLIGMRLAIPTHYYKNVDLRKDFMKCVLQSLKLEEVLGDKFMLGKLPGDVYLFDLAHDEAKAIHEFLRSPDRSTRTPQAGQVHERITFFPARGKPTIELRKIITEQIIRIIENQEQVKTEISYLDLRNKMSFALTMDLPIDYNRLTEVNRAGFHGLLIKRKRVTAPAERPEESRGHILVDISLRRLAPIVHKILSENQQKCPYSQHKQDMVEPFAGDTMNVLVRLDRVFLKRILHAISEDSSRHVSSGTPTRCASAKVVGEGTEQPLEHLVACVPGIEVLWVSNRKYIRKLELNKLDDDSQDRLQRIHVSPSVCPLRAVTQPTAHIKDDKQQPLTKILTTILKDPINQYMSFANLEKALMESMPVEMQLGESHAFSFRDFVRNHSKHFQILGEASHELITLSHRAQIKRISNDVSRLLRARNPKHISSAELPDELIELWLHTRDSEDFDVSRFGVCYLNDLLMTLPQRWGVYSSEYISNDTGALVVRRYGEGMEDVPQFIKLGYPTCPLKSPDHLCNSVPYQNYNGVEGYNMVHLWMPKRTRSEYQHKLTALLQQQILNMCRGDPSALDVKKRVEAHIRNFERSLPNPMTPAMKRYESVCLRCNRANSVKKNLFNTKSSSVTTNETRANNDQYGHQKKEMKHHHMPCNFELSFSEFIPTFHHVFNCQAVVKKYGAENLFELFDFMAETFLLTHYDAHNAKIRLTAEARRDVLERRLVHILRRRPERALSYSEIIDEYMADPTMNPFFDEHELTRALFSSNLIVIDRNAHDGGLVARAKPRFSLQVAMTMCLDVANLLSVFMTSFTPLTFKQTEEKFETVFHRPISGLAFMILLELGALRRTRIHNVSANETTFDLQDICRTVRNLIYQMTDKPHEHYYVPDESTDEKRMLSLERQELSIHQLLENSGDCMCPEFNVEEVMNDFDAFFEKASDTAAYRLRPLIIAGEPTPEDKESSRKNQKKCLATHIVQRPPQGRVVAGNRIRRR